ncbi:ribose-5-phosphate isomerase RpiA [bacterium endosymbiont of Pedicinus badii]|uniref:ribose-5-phosphate isomerase RpiA n=1 Tax=bacterium endosymbiont of Pedicinus badii TaxID=1719126 RepID=UPI0009B9979B|nr:ribose-5-phosphate isomerase RpiA [bacterium endosymbiont of Pedicinus badii]OQM34013.1 hypothetical protein AOQ89_01475 [bacterium endosymbiont of Pedicinus badii]
MNKEILKKIGIEAIKYIPKGSILGIGTGKTVSYFIQQIQCIRHKIVGIVSTSMHSLLQIKKIKIPIFDCNFVEKIDVYIDSADEVNKNLEMIKGGGGALTAEKIVSYCSKKFICIVEEKKLVKKFKKFPIPVEIIPISYPLFCKEIKKIGGIPIHRKNFFTENGNIIVDIYNLKISNPESLEKKINCIPGVVTNGIFSIKKADLLIVGKKNQTIKIIKSKKIT